MSFPRRKWERKCGNPLGKKGATNKRVCKIESRPSSSEGEEVEVRYRTPREEESTKKVVYGECSA